MRRLLAPILCLLLTGSSTAAPESLSRVVKVFDFEERAQGNSEELPMNWQKVTGKNLPHYVNGRLATDQARSGENSFRLELDGGSLIYRYDAGKIPVTPKAHYRVEGWVKTTALQHARARLTAYLIDRDGRVVAGTERHSEPYSAVAVDAPWKRLSVELAAGSGTGQSLILELELLQPNLHSGRELGARSLFNQDIRGSAWFDDVSVVQVPKISLGTDLPGNLFTRQEPVVLRLNVNDRAIGDLSADLRVVSADGVVVHQHSGPLSATIIADGQAAVAINIPDEIPPGWYRAQIALSSGGQRVGEESVAFVKLPDDGKSVTGSDGRFGVIATDLPPGAWDDLPNILTQLSIGRVKLAVWSASGDAEKMNSAGFDHLLDEFAQRNITPAACLTALPPEIAERVGSTSPVALLKAPRDAWQPQLAYLISRHAAHLERWQLGADGTDAFVTDPDMRKAYDLIYGEFSKLVQNPDVAMPWPSWYELDAKIPGSIALSVPVSVLPAELPLYIADTHVGHGDSLSVSLTGLDADSYGHAEQVRDLALRMFYALAAGAKRIDLPLPLTVKAQEDKFSIEPQEILPVMRTLLKQLSGAQFVGRLEMDENVEAFLFDRGGVGVLAMWDRSSAGGGRMVDMDLGTNASVLDLWGGITPVLRTTSGGTVRVGSVPVLVTGIDANLAALRASVEFDRPLLESSFEPHTRKLRFRNPYKTTISGTVRLRAPNGWNITPVNQSFSLNPGEWLEREVSFELPYNSPAGKKTVVAEFAIQADRLAKFKAPITISVGLTDVGMQTLALREGKDIIVQQMITNYGNTPIDYSAFAMCAGAARQERLVAGLGAGRTTIKRYRFPNVEKATSVRVGVKEISGSRVLNDEIPVQ